MVFDNIAEIVANCKAGDNPDNNLRDELKRDIAICNGREMAYTYCEYCEKTGKHYLCNKPEQVRE